MSNRPGISEKRLSTHRFQHLSDHQVDDLNPNDVTIEIPLTAVPSQSATGARKGSINTMVSPSGYEPPVTETNGNPSEKAGFVPVNGPGRRRRIDETTGRSLDDPEDGTLTRMGEIYQAILNFSIVTRYMIYVTPVAFLIAIPIIVGATVAQDARIGSVSLPWFFTWVEVLWLSLWVCKLVAHFLPYLFQFLCGIVNPGTRKYALILKALELPIATVFWTVVALVTFLPITTLNPENKREGDTEVQSWEKSVKNILFALFVCSLIFLVEKCAVQLISISYHRKQFDMKIKSNKRKVDLLGHLYDASRNMFPMYCKEFREDDVIISDSFLAAAGKKIPGHLPHSDSAALKLVRNVGQNVGRFGDKITSVFGDVAHEITGKEVFNSTSARSIVTQALERRKASEALARRIWMSFVIEGRDALYQDDILEVLGGGRETEAEECFSMLDQDDNGDISLDEMILAVGEIGRLRKSLNHSMYDVDQAINVLDSLLLTVASIIAVLVFISFVTSGFSTVIAAGATSLLSLSFVFSTTAQEVLGSCIFLFVKHPFDVGDRIEVSDKPYVVERISLLFSVFRSVTDHRTTQVPNAVLNTLWIDNFTRSNAMHEQLTIPVSFDTSFSDIQQLREEMERFVRDKDNYRDFQPDITIDVVGVGDMDKLQLSVGIYHKSNWSNEAVRATRRSKFMCALVEAVRKVPLRAPGAAAPATADDDDSDNEKPDADDDGLLKPVARSISGARPAGLTDTLSPNAEATSTGFNTGRVSGSLQRRGGGTTPSQSEFSYAEQGNGRSPGSREEIDVDNYQTPAASPGRERQLSVGSYGVVREPSTGRRKGGAGAGASYPAATGGVPILSQPVPPVRQAASAPTPPEYASHASNSNYPGSYPAAEESAYAPQELPSVLERSDSETYSIQQSPVAHRYLLDEHNANPYITTRRPRGSQ